MRPDLFSLEELRALLERAKTADPELKQFGAGCHKYQWNPLTSLKEIEKFEQTAGVSLPEDYRGFLLQAGDGGAGPFYGLFSLGQVQGWLDWEVEPEKMPYLHPGMDVGALETEEGNWRRGCIPIGSQGDTYFTYLLVAGPDRGRVVYVEYEGSWVFFPGEPDFISWYARWLREVAGGYHMGWFGLFLDGDEEELRQRYRDACTKEDRLLALASMNKFPVLSKDSRDFIGDVLEEWTETEDIGGLEEMAFKADPMLYEQFLDKRWEMGLYRQVIYELYHTPGDKKALAEHFRGRILKKLQEVPTDSYCIMILVLKRGGGVTFEQILPVWDRVQGREKYDLLPFMGHLPGAGDHMDFWLSILEEREDLELLFSGIRSVPRLNDSRLRDAMYRVKESFPHAMEPLLHMDYQDQEAMERYSRREWERRAYEASITALKDIFYETINPRDLSIPRPYRLELSGHALSDLGMYQAPPADGLPLHPLIALAMRQEMNGRLPSTAWDWGQKLKKIKRLSLILSEKTVSRWDDERRQVYLRAPDEHMPPAPYYFDLRDWSVIGRMGKLQELRISSICVEDFSFLAQCKELRTLSLYNTNFTDCRLLSELPKLKKVDLRLCRLEHKEVLEQLHLECEL